MTLTPQPNVPTSPPGPWTVRGVEIRGHADALLDQKTASTYSSPEVIRIHPQRVISWGLGPDPGMHGRDVDSAAIAAEDAS